MKSAHRYIRLKNKIQKYKALRVTVSICWWCLLVLLFLLLINIIGAKMRGKVPSVFGYSILNIVSGSMEDEIPQDSYILIKRVPAEEIKVDDIICFYSTDPQIYGMPNTHRVVKDPILKDGKYEFVTKGDANSSEDKVTAEGDRLIGVYVKTLDGLTSFSAFLKGNLMLFVFIGIAVSTIAMMAYTIVIVKSPKNKE